MYMFEGMKTRYCRFQDGDLGVIWAPTQDGGWYRNDPTYPQVPFLRYEPNDARMQGRFDHVPCLIGLNTQDGVKKASRCRFDCAPSSVSSSTVSFLHQSCDVVTWMVYRGQFGEKICGNL